MSCDDDDDNDVDSDDSNCNEDEVVDKKCLNALILLPTRELAIQVRNHIQAIATHTDIRCVAIVGGMSVQKQTRLLGKKPEIVIGTPGRVWELISLGDPHLSTVASIRYLVIDEADRMVEKGHFQELANILNLVNSDSMLRSKRQTFVFSATLTFVHAKPRWLEMKRSRKKKKLKELTTKDKLDDLIGRIGFRGKPKVIDLTKNSGTVSTLMEARINCSIEEKDLYLYYLLIQYPGRTLVFCNSKDCVRRLVSIFTLLRCSPLPLHSDMHQRQRLKNLDRFKDNAKGLLMATDVAARGLDIPDIQHVIHYQVPQTTENYVHRSGRTARAQKEGLSVMIIGPDDIRNYNKIMKSLKRAEELQSFPIQAEFMSEVRARVTIARQIDIQQHRLMKKKKQSDWFIQAAEEADIILDDEFNDDDDDDDGGGQDKATEKRKLTELQNRLSSMLGRSLMSNKHSAKYPTKTGKLSVPYLNEKSHDGALEVIRNEKKKIVKSDDTTKLNKLQKKKKWRSHKRSSKKTSSSLDKSSKTEGQSETA